MVKNYRMAVNEWSQRHRDISIECGFVEKGPPERRLYKCIYTLYGVTEAVGEWRTSKPEAKESAAKEAFKILQLHYSEPAYVVVKRYDYKADESWQQPRITDPRRICLDSARPS